MILRISTHPCHPSFLFKRKSRISFQLSSGVLPLRQRCKQTRLQTVCKQVCLQTVCPGRRKCKQTQTNAVCKLFANLFATHFCKHHPLSGPGVAYASRVVRTTRRRLSNEWIYKTPSRLAPRGAGAVPFRGPRVPSPGNLIPTRYAR